MEYSQSEDELKNHLKEQIEFLMSSSNSYDKGFKSEAKRLATSLRILLHDTSNSVSLLSQLNKKNIPFYDTADDYDPKNLLSQFGLLSIAIGKGITGYVPRLDFEIPDIHKTVKVLFNNWWEKIIIADFEENKLSRKELVLAVCNKDGGAHIDPKLDNKYAKITRLGSLGFRTLTREYLSDSELASIRQITYEVLKTLKDEFPEYFSEFNNFI